MGYIFIDKNTGKIRDIPGKDVWFEYCNILSHERKIIFGIMDELIKIDAETGETIKAVPVKRGTSYALSLTADGKKLYVGPAGADISVYDTETLELLTVIPLEGDGITAHRISL
jgi:DNA-binding beta-propeller fold protein YncE